MNVPLSCHRHHIKGHILISQKMFLWHKHILEILITKCHVLYKRSLCKSICSCYNTYRKMNIIIVINIIKGTQRPGKVSLRASIFLDKQTSKYKLMPNCLAR